MKFNLLLVFLFFVSCSLFRETVGYQKYPIPDGKKILLVPTVSSFYADQYLLEKEIIHQITEELERFGYYVIMRDEIHEFKKYPESNDHLGRLQSNLSPNDGKNDSRLSYWYGIAEGLDIPYVVFLRFPQTTKREGILVRLTWTELKLRQTERYDWDWIPNSPLPFLQSKESL